MYNVKNIQNSSYKHNNVDNIASMILTCSLLKNIEMLLFKMCVVICRPIQSSSIDVFDPEGSSLCGVYWRVLWKKVFMGNL